MREVKSLSPEKTSDYGILLEAVHQRMKAKMVRSTLKKQALELQTILSEIKIVAHDFDNVHNSVIGQDLKEQYNDLIKMAFSLQSQYHTKAFKGSTLFRRSDKHGAKYNSGADSIFEEDLAAILAAGEALGGNASIKIEHFLFGGQSTGTKATKRFSSMDQDIKQTISDSLKQLAEKENKRVSTEVRDATGKIDISGESVSLKYTKSLPIKVERLMYLMKDATFSAKNYSSHAYSEVDKKDLSEIGLHLGNTNLFKAITGALSEIQMGRKQQVKFFYRGLNHILNNDDYTNNTVQHFSHLRFIYELRGSGLLNNQGLVSPVKFLIYNDPSSDAIFVKDTASIILEAFDSSRSDNNLLGGIYLSASKVQS